MVSRAIGFQVSKIHSLFWLALSLVPWLFAPGPTRAADAIQTAVDTFAGGAVAHGDAVGMAVAVVSRTGPTRYFTYGNATLTASGEPAQAVTQHSLFEIASLTKVFTTNLLGQAVFRGQLRLSKTLEQYRGMLGPLPPLKEQITLGQLASFTSGLTDTPPSCAGNATPETSGCLPYHWPPPREYTARDFMALIRETHLRNWQVAPPTQLTELPAPYHYSNVGIGLLGLILGTPHGHRIGNASLSGWYDQVDQKILQPLGMTETFLDVPSSQQGDVALGYDLALGAPFVNNNGIARINLTHKGSRYEQANPPQVEILGGGGSGATAEATVDASGKVSGVRVTAAGSGYVAPAQVFFQEGTDPSRHVDARVLVSNGSVTAVFLKSPVPVTATPTVTIVGGRPSPAGPRATVIANVLNGMVRSLTVTGGGTGYVDPLTVKIAPGGGIANQYYIAAPAGFLKSSISDMATFTRAALRARNVEAGAVPPAITRGFVIAQRPFACEGPDPSLSGCRTGPRRGVSALSWNVIRGADGPTFIGKNGVLPGFSTQIILSPELGTGIVVLSSATKLADDVAANIFYGLYSAGAFQGRRH